MEDFVHLHVHSHYSLLEALPKVKELIGAVKKENMKAVAMTDRNNMYGAIPFYKKAKDEGIKPIIGLDLSLIDEAFHSLSEPSHIILLAKNKNGYQNLIRLTTKSHLEHHGMEAHGNMTLLNQYRSDIIAIIPAIDSDISRAIRKKDHLRAKELFGKYRDIYGDSNIFLEITMHPEIMGHDEHMKNMISFAKENNIPLIAGHEVAYIKQDDAPARKVEINIAGKNKGGNEIGGDETSENFSFLSTKTMHELFADIPEAIANTLDVANACNLELELGKWVFPNYPKTGEENYDDMLRDAAYRGIASRNLSMTQELKDRVDYELSVIKQKGYSTYFLIVSDLLKHARETGIMSTTRGSAAGSMVSYLTYITTVNPMEYKLPFERFLNPERPSAPDIDMDIADDKRDAMINYAKEKYGEDKVAQIGTFGTMMARGSVRDVARALGYSYNEGDKIAKLIPMGSQGFPMTIDRAIEMEPELKKIYEESPEVREIVDMAKKIEGCARHISVHAAGVVISPTALTDYCPLQFDPKGGKIITQYDMRAVEDAGLVKFDFLGIKNLSILADAVKRVKKIRKKDVDLDNIPIDDKNTFEMLARGETIGLFQLSGSGMTRYLKELRPSSIHDINAMVALYRPGPMDSIPVYIERKHNPSLITYLDPRMKDILDQSFGVLTYQDDVMLIAIKLGGYSWLEADKLRKAMGKKIPAEMEVQKIKLKEGLAKNGMTKEKIEELWALIEPFAAYGFNKAHAASYGRVAYQTAFMKASFPAIYMSAVLTADSGDTERIAEIIEECKRLRIPVLPPDINESYEPFSVVPRNEDDQSSVDRIRFGLTTIKNFGEGIAHSIVEERKKNGHYKSLEDFLKRVQDKNLNKKSLESLIKAGTLDAFGERGLLLGNIDRLLAYNRESAPPEGQDSLFILMTDNRTVPGLKLSNIPPASFLEKLAWEKELLGLYISGHPVMHFAEKFKDRSTIKELCEKGIEGVNVVIGGVVDDHKEIFTKNGDKMSFLRISDASGNIEAVMFPKTFAEYKTMIDNNACIAIKGKFSRRNGSPSILIEKIKRIEDTATTSPNTNPQQ